jgi:hypothetical protein
MDEVSHRFEVTSPASVWAHEQMSLEPRWGIFGLGRMVLRPPKICGFAHAGSLLGRA